ncbi:MAG: antitoxin VapB family protein [Candidatus Baldrarchaeota archaeon]
MVKTISISDEVYEKLKKMKLEGESFSDVINRLIERRTKISDIAEMNILTEEEAKKIEELLKKLREERIKIEKERKERLLELMW